MLLRAIISREKERRLTLRETQFFSNHFNSCSNQPHFYNVGLPGDEYGFVGRDGEEGFVLITIHDSQYFVGAAGGAEGVPANYVRPPGRSTLLW
jgi:hypothetical protein